MAGRDIIANLTRRLEARINGRRKAWKLSLMDLTSCSCQFEYSQARDEMFAVNETKFGPWYVAKSDETWHARLDIIAHLLGHIPHKEAPRERVTLRKGQKGNRCQEPVYRFKFIPARFVAPPTLSVGRCFRIHQLHGTKVL